MADSVGGGCGDMHFYEVPQVDLILEVSGHTLRNPPHSTRHV